jgi:hypothetical protein
VRSKGARHATIGGRYTYVATPRGIVIVDLDDPKAPKVRRRSASGARASALQFRYLFVTTDRGLEVLDVTLPEKPG